MRWSSSVELLEEETKLYGVIGGKLEGRKVHGQRGRCEDNIKIDFEETGWEDVDWIYLAEDMKKGRVCVW